jgi:hypothetical protein
VVGPRLDHPGLLDGLRLALVLIGFYIAYASPVLIQGHRATLRGLGRWTTCFVRLDNLRSAAPGYGALLVSGALGMLLYLVLFDSGRLDQVNWEGFSVKLVAHTPFVIVQDLFFFSFLLLRIDQVCSATTNPFAGAGQPIHRHRLRVALWFALLFALFHLPNPPLMLLSLLFGAPAAWLFLARPNLAALAVCHLLLGTFLHRVVELHTRIGPFYWDPDHHIVRRLFPLLDAFIGGRF